MLDEIERAMQNLCAVAHTVRMDCAMLKEFVELRDAKELLQKGQRCTRAGKPTDSPNVVALKVALLGHSIAEKEERRLGEKLSILREKGALSEVERERDQFLRGETERLLETMRSLAALAPPKD